MMSAALAYRDDDWDGPAITMTPTRPSANSARPEYTAFSNAPPDWTRQATDRLMKLVNLPVGWDGHSGKATSYALADYAFKVLGRLMKPSLPLPSIMPLSDGGIQFEWHRKGWDIEIELLKVGHISIFTRELETGGENEYDLDSDLNALTNLLANVAD